MSRPQTLLNLCAASASPQSAEQSMALWDGWLRPIAADNPAGDDPSYDDNFQAMREEINKLSGIDAQRLCQLAETLLCTTARDIRVITWYTLARLHNDGESGLADGLWLLAAALARFGPALHPRRPAARRAATEWLNSEKFSDALNRWPEVVREDAAATAAALVAIEQQVAGWPLDERPQLHGLCSALQSRLERSGGAQALVPQNSGAAKRTQETAEGVSLALAPIKSGRDLLNQGKLLSAWLAAQPGGWLGAHRLIVTLRWDTVDTLPPLDASGRTRLNPPKAESRAQLKRLYLQQSWVELVDAGAQMFSVAVNHFCLDLQWYLWQGLSRAGKPWQEYADYVIADLALLLARLPGLETLAWNDGTPFADEVTLAWIAEKVTAGGLTLAEPVPVAGGEGGDVLALEAEAIARGDSEGPEAAIAWLQSRPGVSTPRSRWLLRLLMARVAEQYGRSELALNLLAELAEGAPEMTVTQWEPGLMFEVLARRLKLLRLKAAHSDSDKTRLTPEMDRLIAGMVRIDPARAMVLCH